MRYKGWLPLRCLLVMLLSMASFAVYAEHPDSLMISSPPKLVNDFGKALWYHDVQDLENKLVLFDKETSTQISVITVKSLNGYEIAEYAIKVANRWGIGNKGKNNGVLILVATDDQQVNISVGRGLEGALTDFLCKQIIENEILPAFKENDISGGLNKGADAIMLATKGEYKASGNYYKRFTELPRWLIILILIVGINGGLFGLMMLFEYLRYKITGKRRVRKEYSSSTPSTEEPEKVKDDDSGSSGSSNEQFGGYGGGRFGGGGASGKW